MEKNKVVLSRLDSATAAALLAGMAHLDPAGTTTEADTAAMAATGQCFAATTDTSQAAYVITVKNGVAWVDACKGQGAVPWSCLLLPVIEAQAAGCRAVAFQTARRGLVRQAQRQGYTVTGWILKKALP
ncbi:hypothetical protein HUU62_04355 [Rhodoferax sp. 4810]|nr:hypothetical protein [Rhodoferax jenense]